MSNDKEPQKVAVPALLRQGLVAFRETQGSEQKYKVRDNWKGLTFPFDPCQFFVLEVLPVCEDFSKLASVFNDRFGHPITNEEVQNLFSLVHDSKLFHSSADSHPMIAAFYKQRGIRLDKIPAEKPLPGAEAKKNSSSGKPLPDMGTTPLSTESVVPQAKSESTRAGNAENKPLQTATAATAVLNTASFTLEEFKAQKKDVKTLNQKIRSGGYQLGIIKLPEDSIDWLNHVLEIPDLYEKIVALKPNLILTEEIKKLKEQTEKKRKEAFKRLKIEELNAIRKLNRLLIELIYPQESPKLPVLDNAPAEEKGWHLFNPSRLIRRLFPYVLPFKYTIYALPALVILAFFTAVRNTHLIGEDFDRFSIGMKFVYYSYALHVFVGLFTDNLLSIWVSGFVAHSYRLTANSFRLELHFGFFPRFHIPVGNTQQLSRRERIWLHAAPILARFGLISSCVLIWFGTRDMGYPLAFAALTIVAIVMASLFLVLNPLMKSSGYHLLATVLNEPQMRAKAALALVNKLHGNVYQKLDNNVLIAYALASALCLVLTFAVFILMFGNYVKFHLGGAGVILTGLFILLLIVRLTSKLKYIEERYQRTIQYEKWKNIAFPKVESVATEAESKNTLLSYVKIAIISLIVLGLIVPYNYEPGGYFLVLPVQKAEITSENDAVIEKVHFDGGEWLKKGTIIAELSTVDLQSQLKIFTAKTQEQQAIVNDLKSRPKPEEVEMAVRELEVQVTQAGFSKDKFDRYKQLFDEKTISFDEFEEQRKDYEVNVGKLEECRAKLQLVKAGVTPEQIAAAESKLQSYKEECDYYRIKIAQSRIYMPFDGRLLGINLKQKVGHYLKKGEVITTSENTRQVFIQIEVPEPDIGYVTESLKVRARFYTYYDDDVSGVVASIDNTVSVTKVGNVVKVLMLVDNRNGRLDSGMTGYAKIRAKTMPAWEVLSLAIIRFFKVEVWSWIP